jgi:hypothetical protein
LAPTTGVDPKYACSGHSRSDTYPTIRVGDDDVNVGHEATVSKVGDDQLFYLMSHGIREEEAAKLIVDGFVEPIIKELPMVGRASATSPAEAPLPALLGERILPKATAPSNSRLDGHDRVCGVRDRRRAHRPGLDRQPTGSPLGLRSSRSTPT